MQPLVQVEDKNNMTDKETKVKAIVAEVPIGSFKIERYLLEDKLFGMSLSDFGRLIGIEPKQVRSRILNNKHAKKLIEKGFQGSRKCTVDKSKGSTIQLIELDWVIPLLQVAARIGIEKAWDILDLFAGLSIHQLYCDAFKIKFEKEDRQEWLIQREIVKKSFRSFLTDALKRFGYSESWQYGKFVHEMQSALGIQDGTRDILSIEDLVILESAQRFIGMAIDEFGIDPYEALKRYVRMKKDVE
jgi:hypothetical protein